MNDFSNMTNNQGLLKNNYDPAADQMEALKRRQQSMQNKVALANPNPSIAGLQQNAMDKMNGANNGNA